MATVTKETATMTMRRVIIVIRYEIRCQWRHPTYGRWRRLAERQTLATAPTINTLPPRLVCTPSPFRSHQDFANWNLFGLHWRHRRTNFTRPETVPVWRHRRRWLPGNDCCPVAVATASIAPNLCIRITLPLRRVNTHFWSDWRTWSEINHGRSDQEENGHHGLSIMDERWWRLRRSLPVWRAEALFLVSSTGNWTSNRLNSPPTGLSIEPSATAGWSWRISIAYCSVEVGFISLRRRRRRRRLCLWRGGFLSKIATHVVSMQF